MYQNCPVCGNPIRRGKHNGVCPFCKKSYVVEKVVKGNKVYFYLKECEDNKFKRGM